MTQPTPKPTATDVVEGFLHALERGELETALSLVTDDLIYTNVSLPTVHGKGKLERLGRPLLGRLRMRFALKMHHIAADGNVVLTDRTDQISFGRLHMSFWVYGRFVIRDGQIAVWRDSFDWLDITIAAVRGLIGIVIPAAARRLPA